MKIIIYMKIFYILFLINVCSGNILSLIKKIYPQIKRRESVQSFHTAYKKMNDTKGEKLYEMLSNIHNSCYKYYDTKINKDIIECTQNNVNGFINPHMWINFMPID